MARINFFFLSVGFLSTLYTSSTCFAASTMPNQVEASSDLSLVQYAEAETAATHTNDGTTTPLIEQGLLLKFKDPKIEAVPSLLSTRLSLGVASTNLSGTSLNEFGYVMNSADLSEDVKPEVQFSAGTAIRDNLNVNYTARFQFLSKNIQAQTAEQFTSSASLSFTTLNHRLSLGQKIANNWVINAGTELSLSQVRMTSTNKLLTNRANEKALWAVIDATYLLNNRWGLTATGAQKISQLESEFTQGLHNYSLGLSHSW